MKINTKNIVLTSFIVAPFRWCGRFGYRQRSALSIASIPPVIKASNRLMANCLRSAIDEIVIPAFRTTIADDNPPARKPFRNLFNTDLYIFYFELWD